MPSTKRPPVSPPRAKEPEDDAPWVGPAMPMINRKGRSKAVVVDIEVLRNLVERVQSLEQQQAEQRQQARQSPRIEFGFDPHQLPPHEEVEESAPSWHPDEQLAAPATAEFHQEFHPEFHQGPNSDFPSEAVEPQVVVSAPREPDPVEAESVPLSGSPGDWFQSDPVVAPSMPPPPVPEPRLNGPAYASPPSLAAPVGFSAPAADSAFNPFDRDNSMFGAASVAEPMAPRTQSAIEARRQVSTPGIAPDIARLFSAFGAPSFKYREVGARERAARVTATAEMRGKPVVARDVQIIPDVAPRVVSRPVTVAIVGLSPGVGRTTIAANLAASLSQRVARSAVIGLDPRNDLTTHFGGFEKQVGVINRGTTLDRLRSIKSGTVCVPFGSTSPAAVRELDAMLAEDPGWLEERLLPMVIDATEIWTLDTPADEGFLLDNALGLADIVIIATTADPHDLSAMARLEESLRSQALRSNRLPPYVLLNRFDSRRELDRGAQASLNQHWGSRLVPLVLHEDAVVQKAAAAKTLVVQAAPTAQVAADFAALADWVRSRKIRSRRDRPRMVGG